MYSLIEILLCLPEEGSYNSTSSFKYFCEYLLFQPHFNDEWWLIKD